MNWFQPLYPDKMSNSDETLELTFALNHLEQHLGQNDSNTKKLLKLQQRIIAKEKRIRIYLYFMIYSSFQLYPAKGL